MNRKNNSTWTDELRSAFENAELSPSEGSWERLQADLVRRRGAAWLPYAGLVAAVAAVVLGVFLFTRKDIQQGVTVVENPLGGIVAQAPETLELTPDIIEQESKAPALPETPAPFQTQTRKALSEPYAAPAQEATPVQLIAPVQEAEPIQEAAPIVEATPTQEEAPAQEQTSKGNEPVRDDVTQIHPVTLQRSRERRKMRISLAGGGLGGNQGVATSYSSAADFQFTTLMTKSGEEVFAAAQPEYVKDISELIEHQVPVKLGINLDIPVGRNSYIGSGLEYFYLNSSIAGEKQTLHWLGIPLNFKYRLVQKQTWAAGIGTGATVEKCLNASLLGRDYKESAQLSANVFADLRVALTPMLSLYACPELSYYFTQTNLPIYRSGKPLTFGVTAGLAIEL